MKICKNCGEINQSDAEYCCNCGKASFDLSDELTCPQCGASNGKGYTHCINCGAPLEENVGTDDADTLAAVDLRNELQQSYADSQMEAAKEHTTCPNCGAEIGLNSIYCYKCGTPVSRLQEHRVVRRKVCPHCGTPNLPANPYCSYCFTELANARSDDYQLIHETKQLGKGVVKQAFLQNADGKLKICNGCGALNRLEEHFCVNCGLKLDMEVQVRYCVNCGAENDADAQFCTKCQWSFDGVSPDSVDGVWNCPNCHHINDKNSDFCTHCGEKRDSDNGGVVSEQLK
ncbi:MAG: zinc ribbon domain-containing protein [Corallococcus sp.]|nr:zinc ribbon domain-containing protein [Corallococcus sp.]